MCTAVLQVSKGDVEGALAALLDALEHAMPAADYLEGLVSLTQHNSQGVRRRALRLFASRMDSLQTAAPQDEQDRFASALRHTSFCVFLDFEASR